MIRGDRILSASQYQGTARTGKAASAGQSQPVSGATGLTVSETLREMAGKVSQMEGDLRAGRRTLQTGQGGPDACRDDDQVAGNLLPVVQDDLVDLPVGLAYRL